MNNKKKTHIVLFIFLIGALVLGLCVNRATTHLATEEQRQNSHEKLELIESLISSSIDAEDKITENFDSQFNAMAESVALLCRNVSGFEYSDAHMDELRTLTGVDYLSIRDKDDNIVAESGTELELPQEDWMPGPHAYTADIDASHSVRIVQNTDQLEKMLNENASLAAVLNDIHVGQDGFVFAVHKINGTILYWPEEDLIETKASDHGIDISRMEDGADLDITIDGVRYFCSVKQVDNGLITTAVPYSEINQSLMMTLIIALVIYCILAGIIIMYCGFLTEEHAGREEKGYNTKLGNSVLRIAVCGAIFAFAVTYYTQTLFTLSEQSVTNNKRGRETLETLNRNKDTLKTETEQYRSQNLAKARVAAYICNQSPDELLSREFMIELRNALDVEAVTLIDKDGHTKAADSNLWSFSISDNPEDQSYAFRKVLSGDLSEYVQDTMQDDSGNYRQYIGTAIIDDNYQTIGMVQIGVSADAIRQATLNTDIESVLKGIQIGKGGFAFAVNTEDNTFAYFPDSALIGTKVTDYGMQEYMLKNDYNDFITIDGEKYYTASGDYDNYIIYIAVPAEAINTTAFPVAIISTIDMLIFMLILWALLSFNTGNAALVKAAVSEEDKKDGDVIDVDMGGGRISKSRSVAFRWSHNGIDWDEMSAGQKTFFLLNIVLTIIALLILVSVIFADKLFAENALIRFILTGEWHRGANIFSFTYCILIVLAIVEITILIRRFIIWIAHSMSAKGETVCRMADNFIRTFSVIAIIYVVLSILGVDTDTLLKSAGILSLVVGLGAQSLISDILAGLFIIFEGEFQVGDIVTIDGFRGTVVEIGVRTTKVKEGSGNVKIFSNSSVKNILNMTKDLSIVSIDMGIEYGEDLRYVEKVLQQEFPAIKAKLPAILDGPFYRGVSELADSSVNIRIVAQCREEDRIQLDRDLRRRLKLIFDEHNINIPYPQVVINQPVEITHDISERQERQAEHFVKKQTEEFKDTGIKEE